MENKAYNENYRTVRIRTDDYNDLLKVSEKTEIKLVNLIKIGVRLLKKKYRIKESEDGN